MSKDGLSRPPYMLLFGKDWLAKTAGMSVEEEGCYMRLMIVARVQSEDWCSLPNDDQILARMCNVSLRKWRHIRCRLIPSCFEVEGDRLIHPRLREEAARQLFERDQKAFAGRASAASRAQQALNRRSTSVPTAAQRESNIAVAFAVDVEASTEIATQSLPQPPVEAPTPAPAVNGRVKPNPRAPCKDWIESFADHFWPAYPRHVGKGAAMRAWNKLGLTPEATPDPAKFFNRVMDGLDAWKARHSGTEHEFIPHPSTWLNQRRWEDTDK